MFFRARIAVGCTILFFLLATTNVYPWGSTGHRFINLNAVHNLPASMSKLKADSLFYAEHASDADYRKSNSDTSFFNESKRHFIDIDIYPNFHSLPHNLDSVIALYGRDYVKQEGTNPWAAMMVMDSLTAQLVRGDTAVRQTMADLGHYVGDGHQPLHCTWNYNPGGLHSRYETGLINAYQNELSVYVDSAHYISNPLDFIFSYIYHSQMYVDTVIAADANAKTTSGWDGSSTPVPASYYTALWDQVHTWTNDQFQRATVELACLWYTAWVNAQAIMAVHNLTPELPDGFTLNQNYPNPFNPSTVISYTLPMSGITTLKVFDALGREIATLVHEVQPPGTYTIRWNASGQASGVYFCRLETTPTGDAKRTVIQTKRMVLMR